MSKHRLLSDDRPRLTVARRKRIIGGVVHHASAQLERWQTGDSDLFKAEFGTVRTNPNGYQVFGPTVAAVAHQHPYVSVFSHA